MMFESLLRYCCRSSIKQSECMQDYQRAKAYLAERLLGEVSGYSEVFISVLTGTMYPQLPPE